MIEVARWPAALPVKEIEAKKTSCLEEEEGRLPEYSHRHHVRPGLKER